MERGTACIGVIDDFLGGHDFTRIAHFDAVWDRFDLIVDVQDSAMPVFDERHQANLLHPCEFWPNPKAGDIIELHRRIPLPAFTGAHNLRNSTTPPCDTR